MENALNLGKGTLETQLLKSMDQKQLRFERTVMNNIAQYESKHLSQDDKIRVIHDKYYSWMELQKENKNSIDDLKLKISTDNEQIYNAMDK